MRRFKYWLINVFGKKEITEIQDKFTQQVKRIEFDSRRKNEEIEIVHRIFSEKDHCIVGEADNKNGEHVFIVQWVSNNNICFKLYSSRYKAINGHPRIMATYRKPYDGDPYIHIDDILVEDNNAGNGSILMPYFIKYCKQYTDAKYISGSLSSVDIDHFDRSEHFYRKHGFNVEMNKDKSSGRIRLQIEEANI